MMLRTLDEKGGIAVYTHNLVQELLRIDARNEYVLFYRSDRHLGGYAHLPNITERVVSGASKILWDQVAIPRACRRDNIDLLFHPKFTVPLFAPCKTIMVVHGADWFFPEQAQYYPWWDVLYIRAVMPLYFKKASRVLSVSQLTTGNFYQALRLPAGKVQTVYFGPARHFRPVTDPERLAAVQARYNLPDRFIFTLTKRQGGKRKNLGKIFEAYRLYHAQSDAPHRLVVGGKDCNLYRTEYDLPQDDYGADIFFPGWIDQQHLPSVYSLASLYLYPSNLEAFPIPITEAMACGTPILTSKANGLEEIAGDAALLVDPQNPAEIAEGMLRILSDPALRQSLSACGLERASLFTWERCASETLRQIEEVYQS
ncbi:MAG TPA: glycosyltransferase family 1 protein [Levilinea sp.]|nr:glycosyltransferase family 1 protein [Levilinea sp.]